MLQNHMPLPQHCAQMIQILLFIYVCIQNWPLINMQMRKYAKRKQKHSVTACEKMGAIKCKKMSIYANR